LPQNIDPEYDAHNPDAALWVAATLLDSAILAYEQCITRLTDTEKEQFYQESKRFGRFFGVPHRMYPSTWPAFQAWMQKMIVSDTLTVTPTAKEILHGLLYGTWIAKLAAPFNYVMAAQTVPPNLADAFNLKRNLWSRAGYKCLVYVARILVRLVPARYRGVPPARRRERHKSRV
jgi:uncharacterized protein (DUF2236 family)